ncbi:MAG: hypothetical protein DIU62_002640 [Pseudomonadota bacterium]|jgi:hypothetical protein|nr:MAG: hypothetical protein DIU62_03840 [Pseudomonadota bacterium]
MNAYHCATLLLALPLAAGCAGQVGFGEEGRADDQYIQERRLCMTRPPAEVEACMKRVEQDYIAREGMRRRGEEGAAEGGPAGSEAAEQPAPQ